MAANSCFRQKEVDVRIIGQTWPSVLTDEPSAAATRRCPLRKVRIYNVAEFSEF